MTRDGWHSVNFQKIVMAGLVPAIHVFLLLEAP
jgi:hypothetical protein